MYSGSKHPGGTGRDQMAAVKSFETVTPVDAEELQAILRPGSRYSPPFRPRGSGTSDTDCNASALGTIIDMTSMDTIGDVDVSDCSITVQAGARIRDVVSALAEAGMQLDYCHDLPQRTVGGAVAGGSIGPAMRGQGAYFSSQAIGLKVVTPLGKIVAASSAQPEILNMLRLSYGMLGVIFEVTLRIRPIRAFSATQKACSLEQFAAGVPKLVKSDVGLRYSFLPFHDRVYVNLRRIDEKASDPRKVPWMFKDWSEQRALPAIGKAMRYVIPVPELRYRLVDGLANATQSAANSRLVANGDPTTAQIGPKRTRPHFRATWLFPADGFVDVLRDYAEFCTEVREDSGFRCDMPSFGYLVRQDQSAALSPSFDANGFSLTAVSTSARGWQDFTIDFGEFARQRGGAPLMNLSPEASPDSARAVFGNRMSYFRNLRRQTDPENRLMNSFMSRYFM